MGDKLLAHADARVLDGKLIAGKSRRRARLFNHTQADDAPRRGVLDGVAQQIQQNLVQPQTVAENVLVDHVHRVHIQLHLLGVDVRLDDVPQAVENVRQGAGLLLQGDLPALDPAHVQYVVDEAEQMVAGGHDLFQVPLHLLLLVNVGAGQGGKANNSVHGRADVVGHVGQKYALGFAGPVGLGQSVLQQHFLLHLIAGFIVHVPEPQHHPMAPFPLPCAHRLHLEKPHFIPADGAVVGIKDVLIRQLLLQKYTGHAPAHHLHIVRVHAPLYVPAQALLQNQLLVGEDVLQYVVPAVVDPERTADAGVQIKIAHQIVVHAQGLDQLHLAPLLIHPLPLLLELLGGAVQQEPLVNQLPVLLNQLYAAYHM